MIDLSRAVDLYPYRFRIKIPKFERNKRIRDLLIFLSSQNRVIGDFLIDPFYPKEEFNSVQMNVGYGVDVPEDKMFAVQILHKVQGFPFIPMEKIHGKFSKKSNSFVFSYWRYHHSHYAIDASKTWFFNSKELDWNKFENSLKMFCIKIL